MRRRRRQPEVDLPIKSATPGTVLELQSAPSGPIVVQGYGNTVRIGRNVKFAASVMLRGDNSILEIGDDCDINGMIEVVRGGAVIRIGRGTTATGIGIALHEPGEVLIGRDCMFSWEIHMDVSDVHPIYDRETGERVNPPKPVVIGDRVWIGSRVLIMKGARIGDGTIVGAGSIVVGTLPADCIAAGSPAKALRKDVTWRRDFDDVPRPRARRRRLRLFGREVVLPEIFQPQTVTPFHGDPPAALSGTEIARAELFGQHLTDIPVGGSAKLLRRPEYANCYLDTVGEAFDPRRNQPAKTPGARPIQFRGFGFDKAAGALARGIDVVIDGKPYAARYGLRRDDVAKAEGDPGLALCGFLLTLAAEALPTGPHTVNLRMIAADGTAYYEGPQIAFEVV
ncbi:MAG: acyltransferase [Phenylobacterium sp.]|nr:MAG: acyltransferase [Phenylobacterium sp.]